MKMQGKKLSQSEEFLLKCYAKIKAESAFEKDWSETMVDGVIASIADRVEVNRKPEDIVRSIFAYIVHNFEMGDILKRLYKKDVG